MREIEFRGKCKFDNKWYYGFLFKDCFIIDSDEQSHGEYLNDDNSAWIDTYMNCVDSQTVGQYTGLKDKNGTKIFDGDIVKVNCESYTEQWKDIGVVEYFKCAFGVSYENGKHFLAFNNMSMYVRCYEVIGNIHDNPELIEK